MARKTKPGLDYFPMDVDFFEDDKVELISSEFGPKGETITLRILCKIFRNGYYYQWGKDESLLFAKRVGNGVTGALVDEVVHGLIKRSFFDKGVFDSFMILTSKGIQTRYIDAKERAKQVVFFKEYALIDINVLNKWNNVVIKSINEDINTQRKEEKRKEESTVPAPDLSGSNLFRKPTIPTLKQVQESFIQRGGTLEQAQKFFDKYEATGWYLNNSPVKAFASLIPGFISAWNEKSPAVKPGEKRMVY